MYLDAVFLDVAKDAKVSADPFFQLTQLLVFSKLENMLSLRSGSTCERCDSLAY